MKNTTWLPAFFSLIFSTASFGINSYSSGDTLYVWAYHSLTLRSAPAASSAKRATIPYGTAITVLDSVRVKAFSATEYKGFRMTGYWSKVRFGALVVAALNFELFERLFCPDTALLLGHGEPATLPRRALSQPKTACSNSPKLSAATTRRLGIRRLFIQIPGLVPCQAPTAGKPGSRRFRGLCPAGMGTCQL